MEYITDNDVILELRTWMSARRDKINLNNAAQQNTGAVVLARYEDYESNIDSIFYFALQRLQTSFSRENSEDCIGMTRLTAYLASVGKFILSKIGGYDIESKESLELQLRTGAIIVEAMEKCGLIILERELSHSRNPDTAPWYIYATERWKEVASVDPNKIDNAFSGLSFCKPGKTKSLLSGRNKKPVVKRCYDDEFFAEMLGTNSVEALDAMQQTGWMVNREVLEIVRNHDWTTEFPEIPSVGSKLSVAKALEELKKQEKLSAKGKENTLEKALKQYDLAASRWEAKRSALNERSKIIETRTILNKAAALSEHREFFYFVECDYRGRKYYSESYLNYQGNDLAKGLLLFSEGRPMTESGLFWLFCHVATSYNQSYSLDELKGLDWLEEDYVAYLQSEGLEDLSVDKMSLHDRAGWTKNNLDLVEWIVDNKEINEKAEKPICFLAGCLEIAHALEAMENGETYVSYLPVSIDGSSNGYQHAAAINRDEVTGSLVGLVPNDFPVDLYVKVGKQIKMLLPGFFTERLEMSTKDIRKNISKGATMVRAYSAGVTSISNGMYSECYKNGATSKFDITARDCDMLAKAAIEAIDIECPSNTLLKEFLQKVVAYELGEYAYTDENGEICDKQRDRHSKNIAKLYRKKNKAKGDPQDELDKLIEVEREELAKYTRTLMKGNGQNKISWTSPSGFKVECNLFQEDQVRAQVAISGKPYSLAVKWRSDRPDMKKHLSSIAANFIHSFDAAHMDNTIVAWSKSGKKSFAGVHDSFAVHASDVECLLEVVKEEFIKLYDVDDFYYDAVDNILSDSEGFSEIPPSLGQLDLSLIKESDYFFC